ncbi:MAG: substrate-binding domain-containing protein [Phycisphaeraceae bacterium]
MARPRSMLVDLVKQKLLARLGDGLHRPGDRFMSNRAIAGQFGVSYQTAHRLVRELVAEGLLDRRPYSGTFVVGAPRGFQGVHLLFNARARRPESFGYRLMALLRSALAQARVPVRVALLESTPPEIAPVSPGWYPVLWEAPAMVDAIAARGDYALLLNERAPDGMSALRIDSVTVDDVLGGVLAAEIVAARIPADALCVVLAGPRGDARSQARVRGFRKRRPAKLVHAPSWYLDDAAASAARCMRLRPQAIFACNDRLAQAVLIHCQSLGVAPPCLIGFDDAPIAESLHLSSIAIPWKALAEATVRIAKLRIAGDLSTAIQVILRPHPITRLTT